MEKDLHTTNYYNTFIAVADDCPALEGEVPPQKKDGSTIASLQFGMLEMHPYTYTSDEVIFNTYAMESEREIFFSKGQACMRSSPLPKKYGWGVHCNAEGKLAIYPVGSPEYQRMLQDKPLKQVKAMRSKKA